MEEEFSEPDGDSLAEDLDLKESSLLLRNRNTTTTSDQGYVALKEDSAIQRINHHPVGSVVCFVNTYLVDSYLSGRQFYPVLERPGPNQWFSKSPREDSHMKRRGEVARGNS